MMDGYLFLLFLGLVSAHQGSPPVIKEHPSDVVARRNDPATLNCAASRGARIRWFKDGEEVATSSQDSRSHRVLLPSGSLFFLRVSTTRRDSDAGTYWCVASNGYGATRSHNATLTIATLAYDFQNQAEAVIKASVGDSVRLPCSPPRGTPSPKVTWLRDGQVVKNSTRISVTDAGDLVIRHLVHQDSAHYVCRARNAAGSREASPSNLIVMTPPWFEQRPSNITVASGVEVEMACLTRGSPEPKVTWRRLDGKMPLGGVTVEDQRLVLRQVTAADSGVYVCEAENEAGIATAQATLSVLDAPELTQRPQDLQVMAGRESELQCRVEGQPKPMVFWRLPTLDRTAVLTPGHTSGHTSVSSNGYTLTLRHADTQDTGTYYCWGVSSGGGVSGRAEVVVVSALPPPVVGVGPQDLTVGLGGVATFPCEVVSEAADVNITWWFRAAAHLQPIQLTQNVIEPRISLPENGALIIKDVRREDAGMYSCKVMAATGNVQQSAVLQVVEGPVQLETPLLPAPPSKPRLLGLNQTAVELSWLPNSQGGEAQHQWYSLEYWRQGWPQWREANAVIMQESSVVNQLTPGHTYIFLVRAVNSKGASFPSPWSDPVTTRAPRDPSLTADQVRQARRRLIRSIVSLTAATATAPSSVQLNWAFLAPTEDWVEGVLVYWVAEGGSVEVATVLGPSSSSHLRRLLPNTRYTFFLVPFWRSVEGTPSNSITLTTPEDVPVAAPGEVRVTQKEEGLVLIQWSSLDEGEARGRVIGYQVMLTYNGSHSTQTVANPWLEVRTLKPGQIYTVRVAGLTGAGIGPFSAPVMLEARQALDALGTGENGGSVLYAPPQPAWLAYLLIPLVFLVLVATLWYLRRLRHKAPPSSTTHAPDLYTDPSINMYSDHKLWRPPESDKDSSLSSSRLLRPDQLVNEYAEPRVHRPNQTAEPYATTALLAPPSPRAPWRHHSVDSGVQVNWSAILPPPPSCPPPDPDPEDLKPQGQSCSTSSQYDNMGASDQYGRPCDTSSQHTYEVYTPVAPSDRYTSAEPSPDRFLTFNTLQGRGDHMVQVECHSPRTTEQPRSNTH